MGKGAQIYHHKTKPFLLESYGSILISSVIKFRRHWIDIECTHFLWIAALQVDVDCFLAPVQLGASDADYPTVKGPASRPILICFSYSSSVGIRLLEQRTQVSCLCLVLLAVTLVAARLNIKPAILD
jgi:hypothetical protein